MDIDRFINTRVKLIVQKYLKPPKVGQARAFKGKVVNKSHLHTSLGSLLFKCYQDIWKKDSSRKV